MAKLKSERNNNGNVHPERIFKTPEELLIKWEEYKIDRQAEGKNWPKVQYVGKDGRRVEDYPVMPISVDGFQVWYRRNFGKTTHQYFENKEGYYDDFVEIIARIHQEVRDQHITGGMLGVFNPNLTARLHALVDRQEQDIKGSGLIKVTVKK